MERKPDWLPGFPVQIYCNSRGMEHDERQSEQISLIILDIAALILENHLLEKTIQWFTINFIYNLVAPYYPANGRPFVEPVSMFKMLVEYLYGIKSER